MVQYRGTTSPIRQYIKSKSHPWGFEVLGRAGTGGMLFDFDIYQGGDGTRSHLGQGGDVVMKLVSTLAKNSNYNIYADNLFTSVPLLEKLLGWGLQYTGIVRQNWLPNCNIKGEKELKKEGRGSFDFRVEDTHISAVKWFDNRAVTLLSTHTCVEPLHMAERWDKKAKKRIDVSMPAIVADYNNHMGGIDILDSFLAKYRFRIRSRRWYIYLFWHFLSVALVNSWLMYKQ
ncbi:piggyBac transposable element-derived protein 3-like [Watersipora subatra]|uniref:piggyBac transposable element-derived protein 3-like n=1 Tax=Watersipora subatra TaxID=2589382 RepID=UPI00355B6A37